MTGGVGRPPGWPKREGERETEGEVGLASRGVIVGRTGIMVDGGGFLREGELSQSRRGLGVLLRV